MLKAVKKSSKSLKIVIYGTIANISKPKRNINTLPKPIAPLGLWSILINVFIKSPSLTVNCVPRVLGRQ